MVVCWKQDFSKRGWRVLSVVKKIDRDVYYLCLNVHAKGAYEIRGTIIVINEKFHS
jgi:hypothetical protein